MTAAWEGPSPTPSGHRNTVLERLSATRNLAYRSRYFINAYPAIYMPMARLRHRHSTDYWVSRETDIVIEGFGRAGNTFAWMAFASAQTRPVRIAHHTHAAAQVITAVRLGIPTLVVVRPPIDAALAHMARRGVNARTALGAWIRFHQRILPHAAGFVVCGFEELTHDFGPAIERVNGRFNTDFDVFDHTEQNERNVFEQIRARNAARYAGQTKETGSIAIGIPTPERDALKDACRVQVQACHLAALRAKALRVYDLLMDVTAANG